MVQLKAEIVATLRGFRISCNPQVNQRFRPVPFRFDPTGDRDYPSAKPEEKREVEECDCVEYQFLNWSIRRCQAVVKSEEEENTEDEKLKEVVQQVHRKTRVHQVQSVDQSAMDSSQSRHQLGVKILPRQNLVQVLESFVDCADDEHVANLVTQISRDVDATEESAEHVHLLYVEILRAQPVVDAESEQQKGVVECCERRRD